MSRTWPVGGDSVAYPIGPEGTSEAHMERGEERAIDIPAPTGTSIMATHEGQVVLVVHDPSASPCGKQIDVAWEDGEGHQWRTRDCHCDEVVVGQGVAVVEGELLATVGSTGYSTGPHDHHVVFRDGVRVRPEDVYGIEATTETNQPTEEDDDDMLTDKEINDAINALNVTYGIGRELKALRAKHLRSLGQQAQDATLALKQILAARGLPTD